MTIYVWFQVKQFYSRKFIPFQMVHPMIASSSSEDHPPSPADPDLVTHNLDLAASARLSSPEVNMGPARQSYTFSMPQIPSRRSKGRPQQPLFPSKGSGSGSLRKSVGGLVQYLRQAMQGRPSVSTA